MIRLTTMLAHSSGEWMSSDWPVCPVAEMGAPHRMGAALTYARRYALFALVGIAGEDDLDAPDLPTLTSKGGNAAPLSNGQSHTGNGQAGPAVTSPVAVGSGRQRGKAATKPVLAAEASAARREELLIEIAALASIDQVDAWAHHGLPAKNTLQTTDAQLIEDAFGKKLTELVTLSERRSEDSGAQNPLQSEAIPQSSVATGAPALATAQAIDFEHYAVTPKPRRLRDKRHRQYVSAQPCVVCGRQPSDAHHLRFTQPRALGLKVSDEFTVPLCRTHHREVHRTVKERQWWDRLGVDPMPIADTLWLQSHPRHSGDAAQKSDELLINPTAEAVQVKPRNSEGEANPIAEPRS